MIMSLKSILSQLITNMLLQLKLGFVIKNKTKNKHKHKKIYCVFLQREDSDNIACKTWQIKAFCICISGRIFLKVENIRRRIFESSVKTDLLTFATCSLLLIVHVFDANKNKFLLFAYNMVFAIWRVHSKFKNMC